MAVFLSLAILNLALGFGTACYLKRRMGARPIAPVVKVAARTTSTEEFEDFDFDAIDREEIAVESTADEPTETPPAEPVDDRDHSFVDSIPEYWVAMLNEAAISAMSLIEAAVQVARLRVEKILSSTAEATREFRSAKSDVDAVSLMSTLRRSAASCEEWQSKLQSILDVLDKHAHQYGPLGDLHNLLETGFTAQVNESIQSVQAGEEVNMGREFEEERARAIDCLCERSASLHGFRDFLDVAIADIAVREGRLHDLDSSLLHEESTGLLNRCGFERAAIDWNRRSALEPVSAALFDIDGMHKINREYDAAVGDQLIRAAGELLDSNIRKTRGGDVMIRIAGQRFFFYLSGTAERYAPIPVERLRSLVAATTFKLGSARYQVTVRAAVGSVQEGETLQQLCRRLEEGLAQARQLGGNVAVQRQDEGFAPIPAVRPAASAPVVEIDEAALELETASR